MSELLTKGELGDFSYPPEFVRIVDLGLVDLEPWKILTGGDLRKTTDGLRKRYPGTCYVPFARRQDSDDLACWRESDPTPAVLIVHDFASPGWEARGRGFPDVIAWFRQAVEDCIEWGELETEPG